MYIIAEDKISEINNDFTTSVFPDARYPWRVEINHNSGGNINNYYVGANNTPFDSVKFSMGEKGCLNASINFKRFDIPIYYGSDVNIYFYNKLRYTGYITNIPSYDKPESIKIDSYSQRLSEIIFNTTFNNMTFLEMLSTTLQTYSSNINIYYNETMVRDYNTTKVYSTASYFYEPIQKLINDNYDKVDDIYWGIQENKFLYLKKRSTTIDHILYSGNGQSFGDVEYKKDWSKIKQTRYHVFTQSTATQKTVFVATIPDGTTDYPYMDYENTVGIKHAKLTAPKGLLSSEVKTYAYGKLLAQQVPENIKIRNIDIRKYDLKIGEKIKIYDNAEMQLRQISNCESTLYSNSSDYWQNGYWSDVDGGTGSTQIVNCEKNTDYYVESTASIRCTLWNKESRTAYVKYNVILYNRDLTKISFMIRTDSPFVLIFSYYRDGNYEFKYTRIYQPGIWNFVEMSIPKLTSIIDNDNIVNLFFGCNTTTHPSTGFYVWIDDIRIYSYNNKFYEGNVISLDYEVNNNNWYHYDAELGDYDNIMNDDLFGIEKKLETIESVQQGV
jgi:hypothetical protein